MQNDKYRNSDVIHWKNTAPLHPEEGLNGTGGIKLLISE
ncbi:hypothetical protein BSM4216_0716 [Bacillus smithii]|jgi:hypothetical protein|nr:hypothetical protein BSM4216_0716 [Bacillus smithii]